jgi:ABC-2 type transport system ATP-binding protein
VLKGIDLAVAAGEVFAFLGPNGAGKTTTVEILEGYRGRDGGAASVLGADPGAPTRAWRERIGIVLQSCELEERFSVRETLRLVQPYYPHPLEVDEVIELVGLTEAADQRAGKLSGGQQRRLDVGMALIGDPDLLFLDEPTTGFDPAARRGTWSLIAGLKDLGKTVFLTTHYLEEAQALADRVAIIRSGRLVAEGTPAELVGGDRRTEVRFSLPAGVSAADLPGGLGTPRVDGHSVSVPVERVVPALHALTAWALDQGHELGDLAVDRPTLEDVYLELTATAEEADAAPTEEPTARRGRRRR